MLDLLCRGHHQVRQLVDDDDNVRQANRYLCLFLLVARLEPLVDLVGPELVVAADVPHACLGKKLVALLHLGDRPVENLLRPSHVGDDRRHQVRHFLERRHLHHLRVHQDQLYLVRLLRHQERRDDRVDAHALARSGRTRDQHVRHARQVGQQHRSARVLAQKDRQGHLLRLGARQRDQLLEPDLFLLRVRHLDTDRVLAGNGRHHAHGRCFQRPGDVIRQRRDLRDLDARAELQLEHGDDWAGIDFDNARVEAEFLQRLLEHPRLGSHDRFLLGAEAVFRLAQLIERRVVPRRDRLGIGHGRRVRRRRLREVDLEFRAFGDRHFRRGRGGRLFLFALGFLLVLGGLFRPGLRLAFRLGRLAGLFPLLVEEFALSFGVGMVLRRADARAVDLRFRSVRLDGCAATVTARCAGAHGGRYGAGHRVACRGDCFFRYLAKLLHRARQAQHPAFGDEQQPDDKAVHQHQKRADAGEATRKNLRQAGSEHAAVTDRERFRPATGHQAHRRRRASHQHHEPERPLHQVHDLPVNQPEPRRERSEQRQRPHAVTQPVEQLVREPRARPAAAVHGRLVVRVHAGVRPVARVVRQQRRPDEQAHQRQKDGPKQLSRFVTAFLPASHRDSFPTTHPCNQREHAPLSSPARRHAPPTGCPRSSDLGFGQSMISQPGVHSNLRAGRSRAYPIIGPAAPIRSSETGGNAAPSSTRRPIACAYFPYDPH